MEALTTEERTDIREKIHELLDQLLGPTATAIAFVVVAARTDAESPESVSGAVGRGKKSALMGGLVAELLVLCAKMGVSPVLTTEAINSGRECLESLMESADVDDFPSATEVRQ